MICFQVTEILGTVLTKVTITLLSEVFSFIMKDEVDEFMREADKVRLEPLIIIIKLTCNVGRRWNSGYRGVCEDVTAVWIAECCHYKCYSGVCKAILVTLLNKMMICCSSDIWCKVNTLRGE